MDYIHNILIYQTMISNFKNELVTSEQELLILQNKILESKQYREYYEMCEKVQETLNEYKCQYEQNQLQYAQATQNIIQIGNQVQISIEGMESNLMYKQLIEIMKAEISLKSDSKFHMFLQFHQSQVLNGESVSVIKNFIRFLKLYKKIQRKSSWMGLNGVEQYYQDNIVSFQNRKENYQEEYQNLRSWKYGQYEIEQESLKMKIQTLEESLEHMETTKEYQAILNLPEYQILCETKEKIKKKKEQIKKLEQFLNQEMNQYQVSLHNFLEKNGKRKNYSHTNQSIV